MKQLGMKKAHREHVIRNIVTSLLLYEKVDTTAIKAKEAKSFLEKILAKAKDSDLHTRRQISSVFFDKNASNKLFDELIVRYEGRKSGFIRSYKLQNRIGDNAPMIRLELVDKKVFVAPKKAEENSAANTKVEKSEKKVAKKEVKAVK